MDRLDDIFQMQKALDEDIVEKRGLPELKPEIWIQRDVLAIMSELGELLDEVNFKWWKNPKEVDITSVREELVDILHFFISMCIRAGMDGETLYRMYMEKNKENYDRQYGRSVKAGYNVER